MPEPLRWETALRVWGYWYNRLNAISTGQIAFATWEEEEQAGMEAWNKWDEAATWLEVQGIADEQIVYDASTETCSLLRATGIC